MLFAPSGSSQVVNRATQLRRPSSSVHSTTWNNEQIAMQAVTPDYCRPPRHDDHSSEVMWPHENHVSTWSYHQGAVCCLRNHRQHTEHHQGCHEQILFHAAF